MEPGTVEVVKETAGLIDKLIDVDPAMGAVAVLIFVVMVYNAVMALIRAREQKRRDDMLIKVIQSNATVLANHKSLLTANTGAVNHLMNLCHFKLDVQKGAVEVEAISETTNEEGAGDDEVTG